MSRKFLLVYSLFLKNFIELIAQWEKRTAKDEISDFPPQSISSFEITIE